MLIVINVTEIYLMVAAKNKALKAKIFLNTGISVFNYNQIEFEYV